MKNNIVCSLCVLKRNSNCGFANATDLTFYGGRPRADQKELPVNLNLGQILCGNDE